MLSLIVNSAMADTDSNYGVYYNNTGSYVSGYWEDPETGERSSTWKSGWTQVDGYNETVGAWYLDNTDISNSKSTLFSALLILH